MNTPGPSISVCICTHNPDRERLRRVLAALSAQDIPWSAWELVVVDNASTPPVELSANAIPNVQSTVVCAHPLGLLHARIAAVSAAQGDVIVFVDDDNLLALDYLRNAHAFLAAHPTVGALGGRIAGEFELPPPRWTASVHGLLALRDLGPGPAISDWQTATRREYPATAPFGAGMVIRAVCAQAYVRYVTGCASAHEGRIGDRWLGGCDDAELVLRGVLERGFEVAYEPALRLTHLIPKRRLSFRYLSRLAYQTGITWGEFCTQTGTWTRIPIWSLWPRAARCFVWDRAWTRPGWVRWCTHVGEFTGRTRIGPPPQGRRP